eukprot:CCRYP_017867-RA/>CCRYP_017867-RA protein AED:0.23 eAED:0.23 QI:3/1/1/1/0/0/2/146/43
MAQATFITNLSILLVSTKGAMSISAVRSIDDITWCTRSRIAFA